MAHLARLTTPLCLCGAYLLAALSPASATSVWMTEEAMRTAFIGATLDGHYGNGLTWTETYFKEGRLEYREKARDGKGNWFFREGAVFCTFYDPPYRMNGGCWTAIKASANCYEFYLSGLREPGDQVAPDAIRRWDARGWRKDQPSTCMEKPSV